MRSAPSLGQSILVVNIRYVLVTEIYFLTAVDESSITVGGLTPKGLIKKINESQSSGGDVAVVMIGTERKNKRHAPKRFRVCEDEDDV